MTQSHDQKPGSNTSSPEQDRSIAVLLVDDSPENLLALEAILAPLECRLLRATSGQEALKILLDEECAVILLDVNMPGLSGYETAALIRKRDKTAHVPIIFLTAYHKDEADVIRGYAYGAVDYVFKPVAADVIRAKVECFIALAAHARWLEQKNRQLTRAEQELRATKAAAADTEARWRRQNQVLVELARSAVGECRDLASAFSKITRAAAQTLEVERVGLWLFEAGRPVIRCYDLYELSSDRHTAGTEMVVEKYAAFFDVLEEERTLAARDVRSDPRMAELVETRSLSLGVTSRLDAPIRRCGRIVGVVCHEHIGPPRHWPSVEQHFAASIADIVALAMDAVELRQVVHDLEQSKQALLKSEATLEEKLKDLERFQEVVIGRELKMIELEKEVALLRAKART